jgi:hypothetical protein
MRSAMPPYRWATALVWVLFLVLVPTAAVAAHQCDEQIYKYDVASKNASHVVESAHASSAPAVPTLPAVGGNSYDSPRYRHATNTLDDVVLVNGRRPINSSYAGRVYDGAGWTDDLATRYPDGVRSTDAGFPDFSPYARGRAQYDDLTGVYATDAAAANRALNLSGTPSGYVWHHVEDGRTLILIPQDLMPRFAILVEPQ